MNFVSDFRAALGLSQDALAGLLDVRQATLSAWENGTSVPRGDVRAELDQIFADFLEDVALIRAGVEPSQGAPWLAAARWWAGQHVLPVRDVVEPLVAAPRSYEVLDVGEDEDGRWSWTVVWEDGHEVAYRTGADGEGLYVWMEDGTWRQTLGHLQYQMDARSEAMILRSVQRAIG